MGVRVLEQVSKDCHTCSFTPQDPTTTARGEGRWNQQLVGLPDRPYPGLWWPRSAGLAGGLTHAGALGEIFVHPDVDEFIQPAELARPAGRQGRELLPRLNGFAPPSSTFGMSPEA